MNKSAPKMPDRMRNKPPTSTKNKEIITCECGVKISKVGLTKHLKTKKHKTLIAKGIIDNIIIDNII